MIKTERLDILPFDMRYLRDYFDGFNGEITRYQWPDPFPDMGSARDVLQGFLEEMERGESLLFAILSPAGKFLGSVEVHGLDGDCPELGVWIAAPEQRKGYAYEALAAVLAYTREKYGQRAFFYEADVRNEASMKLLHKLESDYDVAEQEPEDCVTDSGKALRSQGFLLKARGPEA